MANSTPSTPTKMAQTASSKTAKIAAVEPGSPAERAGLIAGEEILTADGKPVRDVIAWQALIDQTEVPLEITTNGKTRQVEVRRNWGETFGVELDTAVFDGVQTCDNHCEFCFIHQLPKGMRRSLYLKDDDYRLSFLYGNFTTLTRFTEMDYERVLSENLSPLYVSIHATDPDIRAQILQNRRGALSLRWLRLLLDAGIEIHGQVVVCPGVNDGTVLQDTLCGVLDRYPELASLCVVPLGVSDYNRQARMRPHTPAESAAVLAEVHRWQDQYLNVLGRRLVYAADEYYLHCQQLFPAAETYEDVDMCEDGIGMARSFITEFLGVSERGHNEGDVASAHRTTPINNSSAPRAGFFAWVDGAPAEGYRAPRNDDTPVQIKPSADAPIGILTGELGAQVLKPLINNDNGGMPERGHNEGSVASHHSATPINNDNNNIRVIPVKNDFFGGNIGVTGLMTGADLTTTLNNQPENHRYLLPDVCLSRGKFLDGLTPADLPRPVEVVPTHGAALRQAIRPQALKQ